MCDPTDNLLRCYLTFAWFSGFALAVTLLRELVVVVVEDGELDAQPLEEVGVSLLVVDRHIVVAHVLVSDRLAKLIPEHADGAAQVAEVGLWAH